ncbi:MAG: fibronectin type III domain-containing protein [Isosphaeraceae bacterium]
MSPRSPSELTAEFVVDRVILRWSAPPPDDQGPVSFVIRRKGETAFQHPGEGVIIGSSETTEFADTGVVPGTSVSYAVLSRRDEVESLGAVAVGPIFLMGEVRDVRLETRSREVDLYRVPPRGTSGNSSRAEARRCGPHGPADGERIDALIDQAHDRDLESEARLLLQYPRDLPNSRRQGHRLTRRGGRDPAGNDPRHTRSPGDPPGGRRAAHHLPSANRTAASSSSCEPRPLCRTSRDRGFRPAS